MNQSLVTLRVTEGPQDDTGIRGRELKHFYSSDYTVTSNFDRMGCRLEGPFVASKKGGDIISDGIAFGAIQIPSHGKPIIMLSDRQTTGGYGKIANVITVDIPKLAQCKTDQRIRFEKVSVEEAQRLYLEEEAGYAKMRKIIHKPCREVLDCRLTAKRLETLFPA